MQQRTFHFTHQEQAITLSYTQWGENDNNRVAVCVHGLTRHARDFDHIAQRLSQTHRVICVDIVGRGHSSWLQNGMDYTIATYAGHIIQFLNHLFITKVDWIGTSMGGLIAMAMAGINPNLFRTLVLNDVGPFLPQSALARIGGYVGIYPIFEDWNVALAFFKKIYADFGIDRDSDWLHFVSHSLRSNPDGSYRLHYDPAIATPFAAMAAMGDLDLWPLWQKISCPTLVLRGKKSDLLTAETAKKMAGRDDLVRVVEFENIGHAPSLMDERQISVVQNWLLNQKFD